MFLTGCWDNEELNLLFIVTGVALDKAELPDHLSVTVQVGDVKQQTAAPGENKGTGGGNSALVLNTVSDSILKAFLTLDKDSNHVLFAHHNQIILIGSELAKEGIEDQLDIFLRDQQSRLEVPIAIVDGQAGEVLSAKLTQDPVSGFFLSGMFEGLKSISPRYRMRIIDFASALLTETTSPVVPIIRLDETDDKQEVHMTGMAVFKGGAMVGKLNKEQTTGYIWAMGGVRRGDLEASSDQGQVVFYVSKIDSKRSVALKPDGSAAVKLAVSAELTIGELYGFDSLKPEELMPQLMDMAEREIQRKITDTFQAACHLKADIYGFGCDIFCHHPKEWEDLKNHWDELFPQTSLQVQVTARILGTGQIVQSLDMEEAMK